MSSRVVVIGATGTIGRALCRVLVQRGHELVVFSRAPVRAKDLVAGAEAYVSWSAEDLSPECVHSLGSTDAVVYLAGGPLFDGRRHTRTDVEQETTSRVRGIDALVGALTTIDRPPTTLIVASSVGYYGYGDHTDADFSETGPQGGDWWGASSAAIEQSALAAAHLGIRCVLLRTGYVLTKQSLHSQVAQFSRHFGGWIGRGRGWMSWIHIADEVGIITTALEDPTIRGPINATAPEPVRAREFSHVLGSILGHHAWLPVPTPLVRMGLGKVTDILVKGKRVIPAQAAANGYHFRFENLDDALRDLLTGPGATPRQVP